MNNYRVSAIPYNPPHAKYDIVSGAFTRNYTYVTDTGNINYTDTFIRYFYSKVDNNSAALADSSEWDSNVNSGYWASTEKFEWIPQYESEATFEPKEISIQYGDGYSQTIKKGIESSELVLDLKFQNIPEKKTKCILHFLEYNANNNDDGNYQNIFEYRLQEPLDGGNYVRLFKSTNYKLTYIKYKLDGINVTLKEVNAPSTLNIG
jgi:hypothetical protein